MVHYIINMRVITRLYLSGANQNEFELRAPSIKGALRFWFRAMMGGIVGNKITALYELESNIFGNTKAASTVALVTHDHVHESLLSGSDVESEGLSYLAFSLRRRPKPAPDDYSFKLEVIPRPHYERSKHVDLVLATLWLAGQLGGLGSRSRRGFGGLVITGIEPQVKNSEIPPFVCSHETPEDWRKFIQEGLKKTKKVFEQSAKSAIGDSPGAFKQPPDFCVLSPAHCEVVLLTKDRKRGWSCWEEALGEIGWELRQYRRELPREQRIVFGEPLQGVSNNRSASPLMIKVLPIGSKSSGSESFCVLLLGFKTSKVGKSQHISAFLEKMKKCYEGQRVELA